MNDETAPILLGRLQSNFIGTEFQIFTPRVRKQRIGKGSSTGFQNQSTTYNEDFDYDSCVSSDNVSSTLRRRSRFGRLTLKRNIINEQSSPLENNHASMQNRPLRTNRRAIASTDESSKSGQQIRHALFEEEDGVITYTANLLGSRPRIMDVCIPKVSEDGCIGTQWKKYIDCSVSGTGDTSNSSNKMLDCFKLLQQHLEASALNDENAEIGNNIAGNNNNGDNNNDVDNNDNINTDNDTNEQRQNHPEDFGLLALQNRPPWWNIELGSFVLNFRGRVSVASVKNFQLCDRNDHEHIMLQFGRIQGRHSFTMDFQHPLTAMQAFSIAISSLQSKISFG